MKVILEHPSGMRKIVKKGFSWTTFFFGLFVPLIRGDLKWATIMFLLLALDVVFTDGAYSIVVGLIFSFIYNKIYIKSLLEKGYVPSTDRDKELINDYVNR